MSSLFINILINIMRIGYGMTKIIIKKSLFDFPIQAFIGFNIIYIN